MGEHRYSYPTIIELRRVVPRPVPRAAAVEPRLASKATIRPVPDVRPPLVPRQAR
jgi:hypothetical protein